MRFYQLVYRTRRSERSVLADAPLARAFFDVPDNEGLDSDQLDELVRAYRDQKYPPVKEWFGSEREAVVRRLELFGQGKLAGKKSDHPIWPVDIPTDKRSLLQWLREWNT